MLTAVPFKATLPLQAGREKSNYVSLSITNGSFKNVQPLFSG